MEAGKRNISGIFNRANKLKIPHFQRSYVWQEDQWDRFLDDMRYASSASCPYFMGSVILKQQEVGSDQLNIRTVIDGQQRLTTIMLFFKALYTKNNTPEEFSGIFTMFKGGIILDHNYSDKPIFDKIIFNQNIDSREKNSQIYKCYEYFLVNIEANEIDPNNLLSNVLFVGIDLMHDEDEQQIFDTINSLGVRLTTAELLKNYLFSKDDINFYNTNWRDVFEKDDEIKEYWDQDVTSGRSIRNNIDLFLQSYLFIKIQGKEVNVSSDDKERFFKIESVFNSYKEFIDKYKLDKNLIINELKEYAVVYKSTINPKIVEQDVNRDDYAQRLNLVIFGLDTATIIPYVLYVSKKVTDQNEKNKIFRYLEAYLMRRIICKKTSKNYNQLFRSFINNETDTLVKLNEIIETKEEKINGMPTDREVEDAFYQSDLINKQAKGVLYLIEQTIRRDDMHATELKCFSEYSLEHLMPKKWRNKWKVDNFTSEQEEQRDNLILTLGNLTLITRQLNSSIRDSDWKIKKAGKGKNHGLVEYAQGIEIFSIQYLQRDEWNEDYIKERGQELFRHAVDTVWKLDFTNATATSDFAISELSTNELIAQKSKNEKNDIDKNNIEKEFWTGLLEKSNKIFNLYLGAEPKDDCVIRAYIKHSQYHYFYYIKKSYVGCGLYFCASKELNKKRYDAIFSHKKEVEQEFGLDLEWFRNDNQKGSEISIYYREGGLKNKEKWNELQDKMVGSMVKIEKVFSRYIKELN